MSGSEFIRDVVAASGNTFVSGEVVVCNNIITAPLAHIGPMMALVINRCDDFMLEEIVDVFNSKPEPRYYVQKSRQKSKTLGR